MAAYTSIFPTAGYSGVPEFPLKYMKTPVEDIIEDPTTHLFIPLKTLNNKSLIRVLGKKQSILASKSLLKKDLETKRFTAAELSYLCDANPQIDLLGTILSHLRSHYAKSDKKSLTLLPGWELLSFFLLFANLLDGRPSDQWQRMGDVLEILSLTLEGTTERAASPHDLMEVGMITGIWITILKILDDLSAMPHYIRPRLLSGLLGVFDKMWSHVPLTFAYIPDLLHDIHYNNSGRNTAFPAELPIWSSFFKAGGFNLLWPRPDWSFAEISMTLSFIISIIDTLPERDMLVYQLLKSNYLSVSEQLIKRLMNDTQSQQLLLRLSPKGTRCICEWMTADRMVEATTVATDREEPSHRQNAMTILLCILNFIVSSESTTVDVDTYLRECYMRKIPHKLANQFITDHPDTQGDALNRVNHWFNWFASSLHDLLLHPALVAHRGEREWMEITAMLSARYASCTSPLDSQVTELVRTQSSIVADVFNEAFNIKPPPVPISLSITKVDLVEAQSTTHHLSYNIPSIKEQAEDCPLVAQGESVQSPRLIKESVWRWCGHCEKHMAGMKRCSGCLTVYYCSLACQRKAWPYHFPFCHRFVSRTNVAR